MVLTPEAQEGLFKFHSKTTKREMIAEWLLAKDVHGNSCHLKCHDIGSAQSGGGHSL